MSAASSWQTFSSAGGAAAVQYPLDTMRMIPVETDPPLHREVRKALNPYFTPTALAHNAAELTKIGDELIDECLRQPGPVDFVTHFCAQLPPRVLLGPSFLNQGAERGEEMLRLVGALLCEPERVMEIAPLLLTCASVDQLATKVTRLRQLARAAGRTAPLDVCFLAEPSIPTDFDSGVERERSWPRSVRPGRPGGHCGSGLTIARA